MDKKQQSPFFLLIRKVVPAFPTPKAITNLLQLGTYLTVSCFLFFLYLLSLFKPHKNNKETIIPPNPTLKGTLATDSAIGRALSQLLTSLNEIPSTSRKYEMVRSLAEKLIKENLVEFNQINLLSLLSALIRTLGLLESTLEESANGRDSSPIRFVYGPFRNHLARAFHSVLQGSQVNQGDAEKLVSEAAWLTQKLIECGFGQEAVKKWALCCRVAGLALTASPHLQWSLVRVSYLLFKEERESGEREALKTMLMTWLPLLCAGSSGADVAALSSGEKAEFERMLEWAVASVGTEVDREEVLCLWLRCFARCDSSDWPNLYPSFLLWCNASRHRIMHH